MEAECQNAARCAACAFFCDTPCSEAYFRSVECFEHLTHNGYKGRVVSKQAATEACDHFTLACWAQHKQEMAAVLRKHAALAGATSNDASGAATGTGADTEADAASDARAVEGAAARSGGAGAASATSVAAVGTAPQLA